MTPFFAIAAVAGLSLSAAPSAEPKGAATAVRVDQQAAQTAANPNRRYCFKYEITGSILQYKTCKTYSEWMKEGVDPTAKS